MSLVLPHAIVPPGLINCGKTDGLCEGVFQPSGVPLGSGVVGQVAAPNVAVPDVAALDVALGPAVDGPGVEAPVGAGPPPAVQAATESTMVARIAAVTGRITGEA